jgi:hypothetical protein
VIPVGLSFTSGELWLAAFAGALGIAIAAWVYRALGTVLRPSVRAGLAVLRAVALVVVAFLLARPLLSLAGDGSGGRSTVVVLTDASRSMELPADSVALDGARARAEVARASAERAARALSARFKVVRRSFAARVAAEDSLPGGEREASALGDAIAGALEGVEAPRGVVLVSDGAQTSGRDPVRAARELGLPVGTVAVGEPPARDVAVLDVLANPTARVGEDTPAEVRLAAFGPPRKVRLSLGDGTRSLVSEEVALPGGGAEVVRRLSYRPTRAGLTVFEVAAPAASGEAEWSAVNNRRAFAQDVLPDKQRVLVVAGSYHWDWTWARRAIGGDSAYAPDHRVFTRGGFRRIGPRGAPAETGEGLPSSPGALRSYALVALVGVEEGQLSPGVAQALGAYVQAGGGVVVVGGAARSGVLALAPSPLGKALGLARASGAAPLAEARPALTEAGRASDLVRLDDDPQVNAQAWAALPPLEDAVPLAVSAGDRVDIADASGRVPLVVERRVGRGRAVLVNGASTYRWGFSGVDVDAPRRYERWWGNLLRALAEPAQTEPLRLLPERPLVARGEPVRLNAALQDARFAPVSGARVTAQVRGPANREVALESRGEGSYGATLVGLPPGRYAVSARAAVGGRPVGAAQATFWVDAQSAEWQDVAPDAGLLAAVARASGAVSVRPGREGDLVQAMSATRPRAGRERAVRLWESPIAFALVAALLSSEWWLRRRRGLA